MRIACGQTGLMFGDARFHPSPIQQNSYGARYRRSSWVDFPSDSVVRAGKAAAHGSDGVPENDTALQYLYTVAGMLPRAREPLSFS